MVREVLTVIRLVMMRGVMKMMVVSVENTVQKAKDSQKVRLRKMKRLKRNVFSFIPEFETNPLKLKRKERSW
ncbi:unnamed protein product [Anisakis simplex]|uniref:Secreted protein n=1 Tax=Anisakis simplex TaxID=6269 RepID=A0A0M3JK65_ANISI|nr:unnamed protein product [Anisakis simplex]